METNPKIKLIYDISSLPEGLNIDQLYNIISNSGIIIYDSKLGQKPVITSEEITLKDIHFLSKKEFLEKYEELMKPKPDAFSYMDKNKN